MAIEEKLLNVNGVDINVFGKGESGPTAVFLHCWGGSAKLWFDTVDELFNTHRCITFDFRGWGDSGKGDLDYGLDALASDVLSVVDKLEIDEYILVGHSMGGKVAQIVAAQNPAGLKGLVLVAPAPPSPLPTPKEIRENLVSSLSTREGVEQVLPMLANGPLKNEHRELLIQSGIAGDAGAKRAWCDTGMDYDLTARTANVHVPIWVVVGSKDVIETEAALRTAFDEYYPGTNYVLVDNVGHMLPLEAPVELAKAIREATSNL